jgi:predicted XRE-type DNA-binding protein
MEEGAAVAVEAFASVFDALADTPAETANMSARADLLLAIRERVKAWQAGAGLTQEAAAARLGVTRPRLNDLMRGKLDKFSLDALFNIAAAGFRQVPNWLGFRAGLVSAIAGAGTRRAIFGAEA